MKFTRFVGRQNRTAVYRGALGTPTVRKIDLRPNDGNVTVDFQIDGRALSFAMEPVVRDLVDLAAMIYIADELSERSATVDRWSRRFDLLIPVGAPALWRKNERQLQNLLRFLSGDEFRFEFTATRIVPRLRNHRAVLPEGVDTVCLFSGGADSFIGAHELLQQGKRVLLVGHQADGITASTQDDVMRFLKRRFGDRVAFVQARVARSLRATPEFSLGKKVETTHRPRSFLFLALAIAVASAAEVDEIVIPENGLIALNPPLNIARVGTLSTRTAHPRFVAEIASWAHKMGAFEGRLWNPFMYLSKTDVIRRFGRPLRTVLRQTLSCSHLGRNRWTKFPGYHCGYCIPCLYRRVSFAAINIDDPADYYRNVFARFDSLTTTERADIRALTGFAKRVSDMSPAERVHTALSHGACDFAALKIIGPETEDPYRAWSDMLDRWANEFLAQARAWASRDVRHRLNI